MTDKQRRILETLVYFLNRYKESILKSKQGTGFEELVFDQMVETIKELQEENIRLNELNKPKILKGENSESD
tara:strand:+ start:421 stop:636 length:216 start_codon:yes stop_codon:yes gene_type:complete